MGPVKVTVESRRGTRNLQKQNSEPPQPPLFRITGKRSSSASPTPGTPPRQGEAPVRALRKAFSEAKDPLKKRRGPETKQIDVEMHKRLVDNKAEAQDDPTHRSAYDRALDRHGVPAAARARLLPLLARWGPARAAQVCGLWTFLGDGVQRPAATLGMQVWGPAGTGKTAVVFGYLEELQIRHVRLNCAAFASLGDLQARMAEELRRLALSTVPAGEVVPKELQNRVPPGRQLRALDRIEAAVRPALEQLARCGVQEGASLCAGRVVVVLENSQEMSRWGASAAELLLVLPEVLQQGSQLTFAFVGRLPLSAVGATPEREPPAVAFPAYEAAEIEQLLRRLLATFAGGAVTPAFDQLVQSLCGGALLKFAAPYVGHSVSDLLWIGEAVLRDPPAEGTGVAGMQRQIEALVQQRLGLCDMGGVQAGGKERDPVEVSAVATLRNTTPDQKRLILAAFLASRIDKEDDMQIFMPAGRRQMRRKKGAVTKTAAPAHLRVPKPVPLPRFLAIYHRLARQPQLLGPVLLEDVVNLREAGLLHFDRACGIEREAMITCRVELPLARACASELNVRLAEYFGN